MLSLLRKINSNPVSNPICTMKTSFAFPGNEFASSNRARKECWFKLNHFQGFRKLSTITRPLTLKERQNELRGYISGFPDIQKDLIECINQYNKYDAVQSYEKALKYNVVKNQIYGGLLTVTAFKELAHKSQQTPENINLAKRLGWCSDLILHLIVSIDDIMDGSDTRCNQPCWHTLNDVGMRAINDALATENGVYYILKKHFGQKDYYVKLIELFRKTIFILILGQTLDLRTSKNNVSTFTMDLYNNIVKNKTCCFGLTPVVSGMYLAGIKNLNSFRQTKRIVYEIAHLAQVENDYLDCFYNAETIEDTETDIQNNRCSWLAVACMQRASDTQRKIMQECYGKIDPEKIAQVKNLYTELELPYIYAVYKEKNYNMIRALIQQSSEDVPKIGLTMAMEEYL